MQFATSLIIIGEGETGSFVSTSNEVLHHQAFPTKVAMEFAHLQHFKSALAKLRHKYSWRLVGNNPSDPPDFFITRGEGSIGLELAQFASEGRRQQTKFFESIEERFLEAFHAGRLQNLAGIHVELSFRELGGKPMTLSDQTLGELIVGFESLRDRQWEAVRDATMTADSPFPLGATGSAGGGSVTWQVNSVATSAFHGGALADEAGFKLTHSYREWIEVGDVIQILDALIEKKDRPTNDELLISAGGPDRDGRMYANEGSAIGIALGTKGLRSQYTPTYLSRVFVDIWGGGLFVVYDRDGVAG